MAAESLPLQTAPPQAWPVLSSHERRILGVLIEKAQTTAGGSPLSINSLVTGSNQKSNRDPLMNLSEVNVEEALASTQKKGLVTQIIGGRVDHWKHTLYNTWTDSKVELAILAELLVRGPQTEGELRGRASRMEPIADVDALRGVLKPMAERKLVVYLTPEGRRGTVVTHGFHAPEELERLRGRQWAQPEETSPEPSSVRPAALAPSAPVSRAPEMQAEMAALKETVGSLQAQLAALAEQVRAIREGLGM